VLLLCLARRPCDRRGLVDGRLWSVSIAGWALMRAVAGRARSALSWGSRFARGSVSGRSLAPWWSVRGGGG